MLDHSQPPPPNAKGEKGSGYKTSLTTDHTGYKMPTYNS